MKPAKSTCYAAILLTLAFGNAIASSEMTSTDSATEVSKSYDVDADHDGRTDHTLELEQSDSLA